ncbi:hypothetical protein T492DRAFT_1077961 [Pavlovales sp. CCMP2436]|nr:hypothetical protein T492DRAFT_1077961 [Pavlovales sp. CCMP2436]
MAETLAESPADAKARAIEAVLQRQCELDSVAAAFAQAQRDNELLHSRNEVLTNYIDNLMYTVTSNDLALAPPATRSKGMNPFRRIGIPLLAPVLERADGHASASERAR